MIEMFVGSSLESQGLAKKVARKISREIPVISPLPWQNAFSPGNFTLSELIKAAGRYQLALLMFSGDDITDSRAVEKLAPRDNVLLEAGLFLSRLGHRRVALVLENEVKFPSDLAGLVHAEYSSLWSSDRIAQEVTRQLAVSWGFIQDPGRLGIEAALRGVEKHSAAQAESLYFPDPENQAPVVIDSRPCGYLYRDGLAKVARRFWTTSFLTSAFWTGTEVTNVLSANRNMLRKLAAHGDGSARRIFLLPVDRETYLLDRKAEVRRLRHSEDSAAIQDMKVDVTRLRKHVERMTADGFETRVVHDPRNRAWHELMRIFDVHHRPEDTELAIYDSFRVDLFSGGSHGITDKVVCFFEGVRDFEEILAASQIYFERIWEGGESAVDFLRLYEDAVYRAAQEIDYTPNWLARYDYRLSEADEALKTLEFDRTAELIFQHVRRPIARYLDIGSCTARYPIQLLRKGLFAPSPTIIALENDEDAYMLMRAKLDLPGYEAECQHITPQSNDFMLWSPSIHPGRFDLVTCMLGTISHLAAPGPGGKSQLPSAVQKMSERLAEGGILVVGCWSEEAIRRKDFLAIYTPHDKLLLSKWSPRPDEMAAALAKCGLRFEMHPVGDRLDLYFCTREEAAAG